MGATPPAQQQQVQQPPTEATSSGTGEQVPQGMKPLADGRVQVLSQGAYKRLKEEAREKGRKEAMEALLKETGFSTPEDMKRALSGRGQQPPKPNGHQQQQQQQQEPKQQTEGQQQGTGKDKWEKERYRWLQERDALNRRISDEAKSRKELQELLDAREAEMALREQAAMCGIRDIDYAVRLISRELDGMDNAALQTFDERKYFDGLKGSHPYLFNEVTRPATTGTGTGSAPPAPKPGAAQQEAAQGQKTDVKKMSNEEFREHLRKRGLQLGI